MKPRKLALVSEQLVPRGDGRTRRVRRNLYECPVCAQSYEASELVVNNGYSRTCGACKLPEAVVVAPARAAKQLNLGWLNGNQRPQRLKLKTEQPTQLVSGAANEWC